MAFIIIKTFRLREDEAEQTKEAEHQMEMLFSESDKQEENSFRHGDGAEYKTVRSHGASCFEEMEKVVKESSLPTAYRTRSDVS